MIRHAPAFARLCLGFVLIGAQGVAADVSSMTPPTHEIPATSPGAPTSGALSPRDAPPAPALRPSALHDIKAAGLLARRAALNYARLQEPYYQWKSISRVNFQRYPGDALGRCINGLTLLSEVLGRPPPENLRDVMSGLAALQNEDGYLGPKLSESRANEDVLAAHNGLLCGLAEYTRWTGDEQARRMIEQIRDGLLVPASEAIGRYRLGPASDWVLSGGDIGQLFLLLDGATRAYEAAPSPALAAMIETMIARYETLDLVEISAQTHASLSAANGILRWHLLHGRPRDLALARRLYRLYRERAMTATFENYNWYNRPLWTEACAVVDSYLLATGLWRVTGEDDYLHDAQRILFNGMLPGQLANGGFGTSPCAGARDQKGELVRETEPHREAPFCCSMRGGEGLARAIQSSYFTAGDRVVVPFFNETVARVPRDDGAIVVKQTTDYPRGGSVRLEIVQSTAKHPVCWEFFVPRWVEPGSVVVRVDGVPVGANLVGSFAHVATTCAAGVVIELSFVLRAFEEPPCNAGRADTLRGKFRGPLLLARRAEDRAEAPLLDLIGPEASDPGPVKVVFGEAAARAPVGAEGKDLAGEATSLRPGAAGFAESCEARGYRSDEVVLLLAWKDPRAARQVIVHWPRHDTMPEPERVSIEWSDGERVFRSESAGVIGTGNQWVYDLAADDGVPKVASLVVRIRSLSRYDGDVRVEVPES